MVGYKVHEAAIALRMGYSGCSIPLVTQAVDQGPVILKKRVDVLPDDTARNLENRILEQEHLSYPEVLKLIVDGKVLLRDSGNEYYVDLCSNNWDIEWSKRQQAYVEYVRK